MHFVVEYEYYDHLISYIMLSSKLEIKRAIKLNEINYLIYISAQFSTATFYLMSINWNAVYKLANIPLSGE